MQLKVDQVLVGAEKRELVNETLVLELPLEEDKNLTIMLITLAPLLVWQWCVNDESDLGLDMLD